MFTARWVLSVLWPPNLLSSNKDQGAGGTPPSSLSLPPVGARICHCGISVTLGYPVRRYSCLPCTRLSFLNTRSRSPWARRIVLARRRVSTAWSRKEGRGAQTCFNRMKQERREGPVFIRLDVWTQRKRKSTANPCTLPSNFGFKPGDLALGWAGVASPSRPAPELMHCGDHRHLYISFKNQKKKEWTFRSQTLNQGK